MEYLNASYLLNNEGIFLQFNSNILETNVINLILLIALILYATKTTFNSTLEKRKLEIINALLLAQEDSLKSLNYYKLSTKNLKNKFVYLQLFRSFYAEKKHENILLRYENTKEKFLNTFLVTENLFKNFENKAFLSVQRYIMLRVASKIMRKFFCLSKKEQTKFLEHSILKLGGNC